MEVINDFNLKKQADDLGVRVWQTPGFLFIMMGFMTIAIMTATYYMSKNYDDPQILAIAECFVVTVVLIVGTSVIRLVEQVVKLNKMKSEFVSVASHQLRTPLSAVKWETELLLSKFKEGLDERQISKIENISELNKKMIKLVNDLLDVARIDQNRLILRKRNFDLSELVRETLAEIIRLNDMRNIEVKTEIGKDLPEALGDPEKAKLVVENLFNNALKYTTSGGKVEVVLFRKNDFLVFEVKDNGVGIPEEQLSRVFEKFFRSDNAAKYQTEGTGLGLYIAKNTVEQMGGKIWFQSIENVGSMFSFSLPLAKK